MVPKYNECIHDNIWTYSQIISLQESNQNFFIAPKVDSKLIGRGNHIISSMKITNKELLISGVDFPNYNCIFGASMWQLWKREKKKKVQERKEQRISLLQNIISRQI